MALASTLGSVVLPPGGAAPKATASVAEQLTDSPGRSDGDSPSSSNPFREPAPRAKSVKYRYTATGKHLSSPLKGSSSSPERKPRKSKLATFTPAPSSHAAKGKAPAVATTSRKRKAAPVRREVRLDSMFTSSPSPLSSVPTSPITSTKDLPPSPTLTAKNSVPDHVTRRPVSETLSLHSLATSASKLSHLSQPLSSSRKQKNKTNAQKDVWDIGNSVWVLVNQSGLLADNVDTQSSTDSSDPLVWWPAQVVQKKPLRVSMFGECPSSSSSNRGLCTIFAPSSSNILSINDDSGAKRFAPTTFHLASRSTDGAGPPTKKPRLDIAALEARWEAAVQSMVKATTLEQDGLPALLSSYATTGDSFYDSLDDSDPDTSDLKRSLTKPATSTSKKSKATDPTRKLKPQRSKPDLKLEENLETERSPSPLPPDPTLQIPGELILAMAPRTGGCYWPAKILEHVPDRVKEKYLVKFLDEKEYALSRDKFFTSEEEGFVRCTLGEWESAVKTTDDPESGDEDGEFDARDADGDLDDAALPPPPPARDFEDLSVRAQLAYVKPVLRALLVKEYAPARGKHEAFMKGGSARVTLMKSAGVRGGMDARFVKAVQKVLCEWVLGETGVRPKKMDIGYIVSGNDGQGTTSPRVASAEIPPCDSPQDDKMEGIEGTSVPQDAHADENDSRANGTLPVTASDQQTGAAHVDTMAVDRHDQDLASLAGPANGVTLSPAIQQAELAPKGQLDLLAEVSQAVATEPSLLPSHPELPKLKVQLLDVKSRDTSSQPSPLTPITEEDQLPPPLPPPPQAKGPPVVCEEFETLSGIEKLDYCLNILLPESIQQILLWRSGERTSSGVLSSEEEQRLHEVGARKATETDWVDDLMRLRAAQARLWGVDSNKKTEPEIVQGGTRSRPRRGTLARP